MEITVLVKVVPDSDSLSFDAEGRHAVREGVELFINPFDQRAMRVALDLRRPGDRVSVASMGPPAAAPVLADAFALGADRVALVSDPALAGSDTLVTARVLTRLLGRWGSGLVLLGARTTDGETGQIPAEIAALHNVPLAGSARRVEWADEPGRLLVTSDTEDGWVRWRAPVPCVVSVGEKVAKIQPPTEEGRRQGARRSVEIVSLADLDIPPSLVGAEGSPTQVTSVHAEPVRREGRRLQEGPLEARIAAAVAIAGQAPRPPVPDPTGRPWPTDSAASGDGAFVLVSGPDGGLDARTLPMLSESRRALGRAPAAVWAGPAPPRETEARLARAGAVELLLGERPGASVDGRSAAQCVERVLLGRTGFAAGLFLSSHFGREVAGRVAARLGLGLTGDAISVDAGREGPIAWSKPAFGGNAVARVVSRTRPSLATVRPGVFELSEIAAPAAPKVRRIEAPAPATELERLGSGTEPLEGYGDLDLAPVAISVGTGVGGPEGVARIRSLLEGTDWAIGATRRVVDAGWVPRRLQVGLTGRSASPRIVVLAGVRGSANHLVGWKRAGRIVSINPDPDAPVFSGSDVGLVADWQTALPPLLDALRRGWETPAKRVSAASP